MSRRYSTRSTDLASELPPISYVWETPNRRPRRAEWDIPDQADPGRLTPAMRAKLERIVRRAPEVMGLNPRKADLQAWRERFAGELRLRGIAAEATPRRTRGRVRKADRGAVLALRKRKITPDVDRLARKEVLSEVRGGRTAKHPWDEQIKSRQDAIRQRYLDYAAELQRSGVAADHALARQIREFVNDMPAVQTRRHALKNELSELANTLRHGAEQDVDADRRGERRRDERPR